jgi:hypothetical protein
MLARLVVLLRSLVLLCCDIELSRLMAVFRRTAKRPPLRHRDRLFWILLANVWRD